MAVGSPPQSAMAQSSRATNGIRERVNSATTAAVSSGSTTTSPRIIAHGTSMKGLVAWKELTPDPAAEVFEASGRRHRDPGDEADHRPEDAPTKPNDHGVRRGDAALGPGRRADRRQGGQVGPGVRQGQEGRGQGAPEHEHGTEPESRIELGDEGLVLGLEPCST